MNNELNQELIHKLFHYDPETGIMKRIGRLKKGGKIIPCDFVGTAKSTHGYLQYTIKDKTYDVHRLIMLYVNGEFPEKGLDVDHVDGDRLNNAWNNLRLVSRSDNLKNVGQRPSTSGITGVGFNNKTKKWRVWIQEDFYDGFTTSEEASEFRRLEEIKRGFSSTHGRRNIWGK